MDHNIRRAVWVLVFAMMIAPAGATGDYSVDFATTDLTGGSQAGAIYSGQTICNSEMACGEVASSVDYALHPMLGKPNLSVSSGLTLIGDGYGPVDYGAALLGGLPITQTFTVYNNGSMPLLLWPASCPSGFGVTKDYASLLAPETGDTFELTMATAPGGVYGGSVTFANNDIENQSFDFSVFGRVLVPADVVWADFAWSGNELGTEPLPFDTSTEAVGLVNASGTIRIKASATAESIRITKSMRIEAVGGMARIGAI